MRTVVKILQGIANVVFIRAQNKAFEGMDIYVYPIEQPLEMPY